MKSILVTGASTGIGRACALHLSDAGHRVFAGVRKEEDAKSLREAGNSLLEPVFVDVTRAEEVEALADLIAQEVGGLQGIVNNAGVARGGPVEYLPVEQWRDQFEVNVLGQLTVTRAMLPLIRQGQGRVVFMGSMGGKVATMMMGPYCTSKFAIEAIGEVLRQELHPWGIAVSVIEPGAVKTEIWEKGRETADQLERELPREAVERYAPHISTIRRLIEMQDKQGIGPEKVAAAVEHALFNSRPKTRYRVGLDAQIQSALVRFLPDRAREALIRRITGPLTVAVETDDSPSAPRDGLLDRAPA
jgi:NAD(P)-dependent dehydrogenase (short-subunit alcohol dehydrogenase family)